MQKSCIFRRIWIKLDTCIFYFLGNNYWHCFISKTNSVGQRGRKGEEERGEIEQAASALCYFIPGGSEGGEERLR